MTTMGGGSGGNGTRSSHGSGVPGGGGGKSSSNNNNTNSGSNYDTSSSSVEEAGAMVGASITKLTLGALVGEDISSSRSSSTPRSQTNLGGTGSSHGISGGDGNDGSGGNKPPIASPELFFRLDDLRRWLERWDTINTHKAIELEEQQKMEDDKKRNSSSSSYYYRPNGKRREHDEQPLYHAAAPSLVAVLNKLLTLSNPLTPNASPTCTPMLSNAIRLGWAKSMVHCYRLGLGFQPVSPDAASPRTKASMSGGSMNVRHLVKQLLAVVALNPRSIKAYGGTRYAALELLKRLLGDKFLSSQIFLGGGGPGATIYTPQDLILQLYRYQKQSTQDVTFRRLVLQVACSVITAARWNRQNQLQLQEEQATRYGGDSGMSIPRKQSTFLVLGALEEKTILECLKMVRRASEDLYPEIRYEGAIFASVLAPVVTLLPKPSSSPSGGVGAGVGLPSGDGGGSQSTSGSSGGGGSSASSGSASNSQSNKTEISPMVHLDELLNLCLQNGISDEYAFVQKAYCNASARCAATAMDAVQIFGMRLPTGRGGVVLPSSTTGASGAGGTSSSGGGGGGDDNDVGDDPTTGVGGAAAAASGGSGLTPTKAKIMARWKSMTESRQRAHAPPLSYCSSMQSTVDFFVTQFLKVGGESVHGGYDEVCPDTAGARALRVGYSQCLLDLLQLYHRVKSGVVTSSCSAGGSIQNTLPSGMNASNSTYTTSDILTSLFATVGPGLQMQLMQTQQGSPRHSSNTKNSAAANADACLARLLTGRVLRRGLGELLNEQSQQSLAKDLSEMCSNGASPLDDVERAKQLSPAALEQQGEEDGTGTNTAGTGQGRMIQSGVPNEHQLQVGLIELSHLLSCMGEAASSVVDSHVLPAIRRCIGHADAGVRLEAANVYGALAKCIPGFLSNQLTICLNQCQQHMESLLQLVGEVEETTNASKIVTKQAGDGGDDSALGGDSAVQQPQQQRRGFGRGRSTRNKKLTIDPELLRKQAISSASFLYHQYSLHGMAIVVTLLLHEAMDPTAKASTSSNTSSQPTNSISNPQSYRGSSGSIGRSLVGAVGGGVAALSSTSSGAVVDHTRCLNSNQIYRVMKLAESLVWCQFNEPLARVNAGAACTCVRAGYSLLAATMSLGPHMMISTPTGSLHSSSKKKLRQSKTSSKMTTPITADTNFETTSTTHTNSEQQQPSPSSTIDMINTEKTTTENVDMIDEFNEDGDDDDFGDFGGFEEAGDEPAKPTAQQVLQSNPQEDEVENNGNITESGNDAAAAAAEDDEDEDDFGDFEGDETNVDENKEEQNVDPINNNDTNEDIDDDDDFGDFGGCHDDGEAERVASGDEAIPIEAKSDKDDKVDDDDDDDFGEFGEATEEQQQVLVEEADENINDDTNGVHFKNNTEEQPSQTILQKSFFMWSATSESIERGTKYFSPPHDLICLEAMLASLLSFLRFGSNLLLSVPKALNTIVRMLEGLLPLVATSNGRLGLTPKNASGIARLDSVRASLMETFSWLPPGSYPIVADTLFSLAAQHIQESIGQAYITTSLLTQLLPREDLVLDARSYCRANQFEEVNGCDEIDELLVALNSPPSVANEREAVLHCLPWRYDSFTGDEEDDHEPETYSHSHIRTNYQRILNSYILGYIDSEDTRFPPPSVLHEVSNWRKPASSSSNSKIRLLDASLQSFAATFGMQSGRDQESAVALLRHCLPQSLIEAQTSGSSSSSSFAGGMKEALLMSDNERRLRLRQEHVAATNVAAALVLCILNLPRSVGSHEFHRVHEGPQWTKSIAESFVLLMGSTCPLVRRASAEGLALLATCGFNENALTLQTSILASLEHTMQGTALFQATGTADVGGIGSATGAGGSGTSSSATVMAQSTMSSASSTGSGVRRRAAVETFILSKSAALLTIGCLRRASVRKAHLDMELSHSGSPSSSPARLSQQQQLQHEEEENATSSSSSKGRIISSTRACLPLPTAHMIRRLLTSLKDHHLGSMDTVLTRVYALHALNLLIVYSDNQDGAGEDIAVGRRGRRSVADDDRVHLLRTASHIVRDTFISIWTTVHHNNEPLDKAQESVKFAVEPSLLAVLIRLMHSLLSHVEILVMTADGGIGHNNSSSDDIVVDDESCVTLQFISMTLCAVEWSEHHPTVVLEALGLFDCLAMGGEIFTVLHGPTDTASTMYMPLLLSSLQQQHSPPFMIATSLQEDDSIDEKSPRSLSFPMSAKSMWAALRCLNHIVGPRSRRTGLERTGGSGTKSLLDRTYLRYLILQNLEQSYGKTLFFHETKYRGLTCPRSSEQQAQQQDNDDEMTTNMNDATVSSCNLHAMEHMMDQLLSMVVKDGAMDQKNMLNWMLVSRMLLSGTANKYFGRSSDPGDEGNDNAMTMTVLDVIRDANYVAAHQAMDTLNWGNHPSRWQIKAICGRICQIALTGMTYILGGSNTSLEESPHFNPILARKAIQQQIRDFENLRSSASNQQEQSNDESIATAALVAAAATRIHSYASLHLEDLVTTACSAAAATSEEAELPTLQTEGLKLLAHIICMFAKARDPNHSNGGDQSLVLDQFIPQIVSSIRNALTSLSSAASNVPAEATTDADSSATMITTTIGGPMQKLFWTGCEISILILRQGFINDPMVLKRLLRPAFPTSLTGVSYEANGHRCSASKDKIDNDASLKEILFDDIFDEANDDISQQKQQRGFDFVLFERVAKMGLYSKLWTLAHVGAIDAKLLGQVLLGDCQKMETAVAFHCALLTVLYNRSVMKGRNSSSSTIFNPSDVIIGETTKYTLDQYWPSMCTFALVHFVTLSRGGGTYGENRMEEGCRLANFWVPNKLLRVVISGLEQYLDERDLEASNRMLLMMQNASRQGPILWSGERTEQETATFLLYSLRLILLLSTSGVVGGIDNHFVLDGLCLRICQLILVPVLTAPDDMMSGSFGSTGSMDQDSIMSKLLIQQACHLVDDLCTACMKTPATEIVSSDTVLAMLLQLLSAFEGSQILYNPSTSCPLPSTRTHPMSFCPTAQQIRVLECFLTHVNVLLQLVTTKEQQQEEAMSKVNKTAVPSSRDVASRLLHASFHTMALLKRVKNSSGSGSDQNIHISSDKLMHMHQLAQNVLSMSLPSSQFLIDEQYAICSNLAHENNWDAWRLMCLTLKDGSGVDRSINEVKDRFMMTNTNRKIEGSYDERDYDVSNEARFLSTSTIQLDALSSLRILVQEVANIHAPREDVLSSIMIGAGAETIYLLKQYALNNMQNKGTMEAQSQAAASTETAAATRMSICSEALRVLLMTFHYLMSRPIPEVETEVPISDAVEMEENTSAPTKSEGEDNGETKQQEDETLEEENLEEVTREKSEEPNEEDKEKVNVSEEENNVEGDEDIENVAKKPDDDDAINEAKEDTVCTTLESECIDPTENEPPTSPQPHDIELAADTDAGSKVNAEVENDAETTHNLNENMAEESDHTEVKTGTAISELDPKTEIGTSVTPIEGEVAASPSNQTSIEKEGGDVNESSLSPPPDLDKSDDIAEHCSIGDDDKGEAAADNDAPTQLASEMSLAEDEKGAKAQVDSADEAKEAETSECGANAENSEEKKTDAKFPATVVESLSLEEKNQVSDDVADHDNDDPFAGLPVAPVGDTKEELVDLSVANVVQDEGNDAVAITPALEEKLDSIVGPDKVLNNGLATIPASETVTPVVVEGTVAVTDMEKVTESIPIAPQTFQPVAPLASFYAPQSQGQAAAVEDDDDDDPFASLAAPPAPAPVLGLGLGLGMGMDMNSSSGVFTPSQDNVVPGNDDLLGFSAPVSQNETPTGEDPLQSLQSANQQEMGNQPSSAVTEAPQQSDAQLLTFDQGPLLVENSSQGQQVAPASVTEGAEHDFLGFGTTDPAPTTTTEAKTSANSDFEMEWGDDGDEEVQWATAGSATQNTPATEVTSAIPEPTLPTSADEPQPSSTFEMEWGDDEDEEEMVWSSAAPIAATPSLEMKQHEPTFQQEQVQTSQEQEEASGVDMDWGDDIDFVDASTGGGQMDSNGGAVKSENANAEAEVALNGGHHTVGLGEENANQTPSEFALQSGKNGHDENNFGDDDDDDFGDFGGGDFDGGDFVGATDVGEEGVADTTSSAQLESTNVQPSKSDTGASNQFEMEWSEDEEVEWASGDAGGNEEGLVAETGGVGADVDTNVSQSVIDIEKQRVIADEQLKEELNMQRAIIRSTMSPPSAGSTNEEHVAPFLALILSLLVQIINFNGLPNSPPLHDKKDNADPAIGRLCAATFVQIGKAAAVAFKTSMSSLKPEERTAIESAMRAELTGYPASGSASGGSNNMTGTKKKGKINFKAFK